jgi:serine O-acetyltransferase
MARLLSRLFATQWHALRLYRLASRLDSKGHGQVAALILLFGKFISGIEIVHGASIGPGTVFIHGTGVVIGPGTIIGRDCRIFHNVTLGSRDGTTYPVVGDAVTLYPGAVILGAVRIGDNSVVGANSVVLRDVGPNEIVAGNPARLIGSVDS